MILEHQAHPLKQLQVPCVSFPLGSHCLQASIPLAGKTDGVCFVARYVRLMEVEKLQFESPRTTAAHAEGEPKTDGVSGGERERENERGHER